MRFFEEMESEVRGYIHSLSTMFDVAKGSEIFDKHNNHCIDFFAAAGSLNLPVRNGCFPS